MNEHENVNIDQQPPGEVAVPQRVRLWHKHPKALIGTGLAVVLALAGGGAYAWNTYSASQAEEAYTQAVKAETTAFGKLTTAQEEYRPLLEGCTEKANDPSLCDVLETTLADAGDLTTVGVDPSKVYDLKQATKRVEVNTNKLASATTALEAAGEKVEASIDEKALVGLVSAYEAAVEQGQQTAAQAQALIDSTAGQVADDNTRQLLAATLSQLNETLNAQVDKSNSKDVEKATSTLTDLTSQVNTQIQAVQASSDAWQHAQSQAQASTSATSAPRQSAGQSASSKPATGNATSSGKPSRTSNGATPRSGSTPAHNGTSTGGKGTSTGGGKTSSGGSNATGTSGTGKGGWVESYEEGTDCWRLDTKGNAYEC